MLVTWGIGRRSERLVSSRFGNHVNHRWSDHLVEKTGLEPATPALQKRCATNCATSPCHGLGGRGKQLRKHYLSRTTRTSEPDALRKWFSAAGRHSRFPHPRTLPPRFPPAARKGAASLGLIRRL